MMKLDPRLHAYRDDLAAASLRDRVRAARYSQGETRQVAAPSAPVRAGPRFDAPLATEALHGELVTIYDQREGWAWLQLNGDGYVGYTPLDGLSAMVENDTHRVSARLTYLYQAPDLKSPPITKLSFSSTVAAIGKGDGRFVELSRGGFIFADHLVGIKERAKDFVRVAERFLGAPYLWGGKTTLGVDCSGLVQIALQASGVPCPRDSDMQFELPAESLDPSNLDIIQRGDLLFWRGHLAIAQSADWMIHASAQHMEVVVEPIRRAAERIGATHGVLIGIKRPITDPAGATAKPAPKAAAGARGGANPTPEAALAAGAKRNEGPAVPTAPATPKVVPFQGPPQPSAPQPPVPASATPAKSETAGQAAKAPPPTQAAAASRAAAAKAEAAKAPKS